MAKLADFLEKLSSDEDFEKKFDKNARQGDEGLRSRRRQKKLIRKGTAKKIRARAQEAASSARTSSSSGSRCG